jgi:hypothetical protein
VKSTSSLDPMTPTQVAEQCARLAAQLRELSANAHSAPWQISDEAIKEGQALLGDAIAATLELARAAENAQIARESQAADDRLPK